MKKQYLKIIIIVILLLFIFSIAFVFYKQKIEVNSDINLTSALSGQGNIKVIKENGGSVSWQQNGEKLIAFDKENDDGYYDVYSMKPDGSEEKCITCGIEPMARHRGSPEWHPSGKYIVYISEKPEHKGGSYSSLPGFGGYCDLWIINIETKKAYQLTDVPNDNNHGSLHPHISEDGNLISWSERTQNANFLKKSEVAGVWVLKTARLVLDKETPHIENIKIYKPGDAVFYENHGFSPDNKNLLFSSNYRKENGVFDKNDIYSLNLQDSSVKQLTFDSYNEHSIYSPDGSKIIWMTNRENERKGTDWWIMNSDGSDKKRLTGFNKKGNTEFTKTKVWATDLSWNSNGKQIVCYLQKDLIKQNGSIVLIDIPNN